MASGLGISVLLARILGPEGLGHYVFAFSLATMLSVPVQAGMPMLLTKSLPKYEIAGDIDRVKGLLLYTVLFTVAFSGLAFLIYYAFDLWLMSYSGAYSGRQTVHSAILLLPFIALSTSLGAAIRGFGRLFFGQLVETGLRQVVLLLMLCAITFGIAGVQLTAEAAMHLHVAAAIVTTAVGAAIIFFGCGVERGKQGARIEWRAWSSTLLPLSLIAGLQTILNKSDLLMLRSLAGAEEVAVYFIANQLGNLAFIANQAVVMVTGPMLARAVQKGDVKTTQSVYARGAMFTFFCTLPAAMVLFFGGATILGLVFGTEYGVAYPVVIVFAAGYVLQALFGNIELLLKATDNEWLVARTMLMGIVANLALNGLMIPWLGALGAALASVAVTLCVKCYLSLKSRRRLGFLALAFAMRKTQACERKSETNAVNMTLKNRK